MMAMIIIYILKGFEIAIFSEEYYFLKFYGICSRDHLFTFGRRTYF